MGKSKGVQAVAPVAGATVGVGKGDDGVPVVISGVDKNIRKRFESNRGLT